MKKLLWLIAIGFFTLSPLLGQVKTYALPQEIVFVHMDNTCYFLGDMLFYKAYVQRSDTGS